MTWASINGVRLYYLASGKGPALVFAHGAGGNHLSWWQQAPYFSQRYRCLTFDHRAFGRSVDVSHGPGRRAFAEDLRQLLDRLDIESAAIVAQSMGGRTAVGFAVRNPGRVRALVFAGTTGGAVNDDIRAAQREHRASPDGRRSLLHRSVSPSLKRERPDLAYLYRLINRLNPPRPKDFLAPIPGYRGSSAQALADLGIPILFLVGEHDAITPPEIIRMAQEQVSGSQFDIIRGAGHSAYFERAEAFNQRVERFLRDAGWASE
ncbi:MAG: alpha/beta fold hydrolase [Chloroflexi bacterium]|nr:alpha/beta fold hydrolase [Chloroflexota bacterium]